MIVLQSTTRRVPLVLPPKNSVGQTGICLRKTGTNGQFQQDRRPGMTVSDKSSHSSDWLHVLMLSDCGLATFTPYTLLCVSD